jgi:H+/gluconate symporter-like permease
MVKSIAPDQEKQLAAFSGEEAGLNKALAEVKKYQEQLPKEHRDQSPLNARQDILQSELETVQGEIARVKQELSEKAGAWFTATRYTAMLGNANFALLISTAIAILLLVRQRKPSLTELSQTIELALMSAGVIILITAAGTAFGAMLKVAQIGPAIEKLFGGSSGEGLVLLTLGFGIAVLLKIAQGSSTAAMIVGSAMLASMIEGSPPPFHPVYLATAIGGGSLVGSWMNDSGFWIFAKMGGLTEIEALKSWTILLLVLAAVSLAMTCLLVTVWPYPLGLK